MDVTLDEQLLEVIRVVRRYQERECERVLADWHEKLRLTTRDVAILSVLAEHPGEELAFAEIVDELERKLAGSANRSTVSQAITRLTESELVHRDRDKRGPREPVISLTERGQELARALGEADTSIVPMLVDALRLENGVKEQLAGAFKTALQVFEDLASVAESDLSNSRGKPSIARVYDYLLGGWHNFAADRAAARKYLRMYAPARDAARANRAFLRRAVRYLAEKGVDQFVDIGSGLPTRGNTHEIAQQIKPEANVIYVDRDEAAVESSRILLRRTRGAAAIRGDLRDPSSILLHPEARRLIDTSRPVAVLLVAVLHFVTDDAEAMYAVRSLREHFAAGSWLVLSHAAIIEGEEDIMAKLVAEYGRDVAQARARTRDDVEQFFEHAELEAPGLTFAPEWHPEVQDSFALSDSVLFAEDPHRSLVFAGVGRWRSADRR
jgi:DNA-binding MarR family transcriptional regulator